MAERALIHKCAMCFFFCHSNDGLIKHVVRYHRNDPGFMIRCTQSGCGATYQKWKSFRQHLFRKHPMTAAAVNDFAIHQEEDVEMPEAELLDNERGDPEPEIFYSSAERLRWYSAKFLINIRESCNISQNAMEYIVEGVTYLLQIYTSMLMKELKKKQIPETETINMNDVKTVLTEDYPPDMMFSEFKTPDSLNNFLIKEMNMVAPEAQFISKNFVWKKRRKLTNTVSDLCEVHHEAYISPFMDNLRNLLRNEEVRFNIDNPLPHEDGVYRTVLDGSYYKENTFFRENKNSLAIILYYDDLGIVNPSSSSSKIQKLSMFYWVLGNIKPELRSSQNAIQLYSIVKTRYLKEPNALENILKPFIDDIIHLQTEGIDVEVNGVIKNYKGSLLFFAGDTPASAFIGGFKESVFANHPCRTCMITKIDLKTNFDDSQFILREINRHNDQLAAINEPNLGIVAKKFWQKLYGLNSRSPLMKIPHFDVTTCLPQDCMHILIEGVTEITCRLFLHYCIREKNMFCLKDFNMQIAKFNFGHFSRDKPGAIQEDDLGTNVPLRQSAAQMFVLAHTLPFLIDELITDTEDVDLNERVYCLNLVLQIMNLCLAYNITTTSVDMLERIIETFLAHFVRLHPDNVVPKFHFLIHVPWYIRLFGPGRQQWCFRFESAHAYYKSLVPVVRNFKNMPYTMSCRHQSRLCCQLASHPGQSSRIFLYEGNKITVGLTVTVMDLLYKDLFIVNNYFEREEMNTRQVMRSVKVIIHGTVYENKRIILLECNEDLMPKFGEIDDICVFDNKILLVVTPLVTHCYTPRLNAYEIEKQSHIQQCILDINNLIFKHPLSDFKTKNLRYVPLINHERCEFIG